MILWGEDMVQVYNEAYSKIIGIKHPDAFGAKAKDVWGDQWDEIGPLFKSVMTNGNAVQLERHPFIINRKGFPETCYFNVSHSPIFNGSKKVEGIFITVAETASEVNDQPLKSLRNKQLKHLFAQAPIGMCILRGREFVVEMANDKILALWGKSAQQVINKPVFEGIPDARNQGYEALLARVFLEGKTIVLDESPLRLIRNGKYEDFFIKLVYEPLREEDGTISGIMVLADEVTAQVIARKKTRDNEERLKLAVEAAAFGTFDWDIQQSVFQYSERLAAIYGFMDPNQLLYKDFIDRIHPEDTPIRLKAHRDASLTGNFFYEVRIIWPNNSIHWIQSHGKIFYDDNNTPIRISETIMDITDQKSQAQRLENLVAERTFKLNQKNLELKQSEERYHKMIAEVQDYAIILLDQNGIIQNWNKGAEKIKQYKEAEVVGRSFKIFYLPADRESGLPETLMNEAIVNGRAVHEGWRLRKDQTRFWGSITLTALHNDTDHIIGFSKVTRDLTDKMLSDDKLRQFADQLQAKNKALEKSEERYHKMIDEVEDYAIILLDVNGNIQNWNTGAEKIKGYSAQEAIGKNFTIFYTAEDAENKLPHKLLGEAIKNGKATHEGWRVRKDRATFWGSIVITALHNDSGELIGFSKVTRDLTLRKAAEDKLIEYTKQLELQNQELEQFAYIASHDLQEPLRKIQTFTEIIQTNIQDENFVKKYFDKINSSAQRMSELIKSVLNYSRLSTDGEQFVEVDLNKIIATIKLDFELVIQEKKAIIKMETLPDIKGIPLQLSQLFTNLIGNALKFTEKPPVISIGSRIVNDREIINKTDEVAEGNYLEVSVADNGIGFEQQYEKQIFNMFQRLHGRQQFSGTGIGLALCKKIVENHNGYITVKSEVGKGTTFYVYFVSTLL
jgi:PAS domain S-box-containing protein